MGYTSYAPTFVLGEHTIDGDTVAHWPFNGDVGEDVSALTMTGTSGFIAVNGQADTRKMLIDSNTLHATGASALALGGAITIACWFQLQTVVAANAAIVGMRLQGGAAADNFPWTLDMTTAEQVRFLWNYGTKQQSIVLSTATLSLERWYHIIATRNAASTAGKIFIDGVLDKSTTALNAAVPGVNQDTVLFMENDSGNDLFGALGSVTIKDVEVSDAEAAVLYQSARAAV